MWYHVSLLLHSLTHYSQSMYEKKSAETVSVSYLSSERVHSYVCLPLSLSLSLPLHFLRLIAYIRYE